jgi:predicted Zn-dependent protease
VEYRLIQDDKQVNAFALPGGKVAVYTGILPITRDEEGLAAVLAHEIGHVIARHGGERVSQQLLVNVGLETTMAALSRGNPATVQAVASLSAPGRRSEFSSRGAGPRSRRPITWASS